MASKIFSAATIGLDGQLVEVEVDVLSAGLHNFLIVGLPDAAIKESRERVSSALKNSGFKPPHQCGRITVNLAPADLPKTSAMYDLPIALGFLIATKQINFDFKDKIFVGELALDGKIRPVHGVLPIVLLAQKLGITEVYLPSENVEEGSMVNGIKLVPVNSLYDVVDHIMGNRIIPYAPEMELNSIFEESDEFAIFDMNHVSEQEHAKRALEIAAAGAHNVLLNGPPGSGKTLLARAFPSILPKLSLDEALEITKIFSVAGKLEQKSIIKDRPCRSPHHSSSSVSLIGGGSIPRPGEVSLAHRGVLFLDEFAEFPKNVLENLRQPLEDGKIVISRSRGTLEFPARFTLLAAMNPCPCGNYTDPERACSCSPVQVINYQRKISGPIMDRIDLHVEVPRLNFEKLQSDKNGEKSKEIRRRVELARAIQRERFKNFPIFTNSEMGVQHIREFCELDLQCKSILERAISKMKLSARAYHRIIKISRTIADIEQSDVIKSSHIAEAVQYRFKSE